MAWDGIESMPDYGPELQPVDGLVLPRARSLGSSVLILSVRTVDYRVIPMQTTTFICIQL